MIDFDTLVTGPCMGVFGEAAEYILPGHQPQPIVGVFDEAYVEVQPLGDLGRDIGIPGDINDAMPVIGVQLSQFRYPPEQNGLVRLPALPIKRPNIQVYRVQDVQNDGHGWALLKLLVVPSNTWPVG